MLLFNINKAAENFTFFANYTDSVPVAKIQSEVQVNLLPLKCKGG